MSKSLPMTNDLEMEEPFYVRKKADPVPFTTFLCNTKEGTILGRSPLSWGKKQLNLHFAINV